MSKFRDLLGRKMTDTPLPRCYPYHTGTGWRVLCTNLVITKAFIPWAIESVDCELCLAHPDFSIYALSKTAL